MANPQGGDTGSRRIEAHRDIVLALHADGRDITLDELRCELGKAGVTVAISTLQLFCARHRITRKEVGHAVELDCPDVLTARKDWFDGQRGLDPERLMCINETWTAINMTRSHGGWGWANDTAIARRSRWSRACA